MTRHFVCQLEDVFDGGGVCALVDGEQVALLRVGEEVFALENRDPFSGANVISRGLTIRFGAAETHRSIGLTP